MLKNYSAAQAPPGCYQARDPHDLELISRQGYLVDFRDAARGLSARAEFFGAFAAALPFPVRRLFKGQVVFEVGDEYWAIDVRHRRVHRTGQRPGDWSSPVRTPPGLLADAMERKIVNFIHISMRLSIELNEGGAQTDFLFWGVLSVCELGCFPLRNPPLTRLASAAWGRRRELTESAFAVVGGKGSSLERMAGSLMRTGSDPAGRGSASSSR